MYDIPTKNYLVRFYFIQNLWETFGKFYELKATNLTLEKLLSSYQLGGLVLPKDKSLLETTMTSFPSSWLIPATSITHVEVEDQAIDIVAMPYNE